MSRNGRRTRRALVLSGSIGRGHDSVAEACATALREVGVETVVVDCMALLGPRSGRMGRRVFRAMLAMPALYDAFHFAHLRAGGRLGRLVDRLSSRRLTRPLAALVEEHRPDLVLAVFATGAAAMSRLAPRLGDTTPTVVFCTDATAHRIWVQAGIDRYLVCSEVAAATVHQYGAEAPVAVVPPPVRPAFFEPADQAAARRALGLELGATGDTVPPVALLMAGGWGLAPLAGAAEVLARSGIHVLAVAGANARLAGRLRGLADRGLSVTPFGETDRVPELMAAADVVITSPGQTCHEARVVGRPLVVLDVVPGHGRENLLYELSSGGAEACTADPVSVVQAARTVLATATPAPVPLPPTDAASWSLEPPPSWPVSSPAEWARGFVAALGDTIDVAGHPSRARLEHAPVVRVPSPAGQRQPLS